MAIGKEPSTETPLRAGGRNLAGQRRLIDALKRLPTKELVAYVNALRERMND